VGFLLLISSLAKGTNSNCLKI